MVPGGRVAGGEDSATFAVPVTEVVAPEKCEAKQDWTRHRESLVDVLGGPIRDIPRKTAA